MKIHCVIATSIHPSIHPTVRPSIHPTLHQSTNAMMAIDIHTHSLSTHTHNYNSTSAPSSGSRASPRPARYACSASNAVADAAAGTGTLSADAASTWHHGATASTAVSGVPSPLQRQLQRRRQVVVVVPVCLWVLGDNAPAIAFYRRHGFEVVVTDRHARFGRRRDYKYFCMIRTLSVPLVGPGPAAM